VVKLLRARGGCLGVIRWRAWKAAKGPGELPNERRSRNTRWRPGELKHLSTRRKRNHHTLVDLGPAVVNCFKATELPTNRFRNVGRNPFPPLPTHCHEDSMKGLSKEDFLWG